MCRFVIKTHGAPLSPAENSGRSAAIPATSSAGAAEGLGTARFSSPLDLKKHPNATTAAPVQLRAPKPPPRPASGSNCLPHTLGKAGEQYGPPVAPFARARCPFSPLFRSYFPGAAARGSPSGQFSYFGPRSPLTAFVLDISIKFWSLDTPVGVVLFT